MFNKNFFPTPSLVISQMLADVDSLMLRTGKILEPSAGKGDVVDWLIKMKSCRIENIDCIEIEPQLCSILKDKKYKIVSNDFLEFNPECFYDLIVMNPPFDDGVKHLLKAIEISDGTEIRCLLNAESINNPYTAERKLLKKMIEDFGGEVKNLGNAFKNAERKTNVEIALIKLKVPQSKSKFQFERGDMNEKEYTFEQMQSGQIAQKDFFGNIEIQYNKCREIVANILQLENELEFYSKNLLDGKDAFEILKESSGKGKYRYNEFTEKLRASSWSNIMKKTKIADLVTSDVRQNFFKFQQEQGYMAFTKENMLKLIESLYYNQEEIMTNCIIEAFDLMTKYHEENRVHIEGWKTNKSWKVTKKVILPCMRDTWASHLKLSYTADDKIRDIEKAMCFIMKKSFENINSISKVFSDMAKKADQERNLFDNSIKPNTWYDSEFFRFKMFLKGTLHIEFKDKYLYEQFNLIVCKGKNWLPDMPKNKRSM